METEMRDVQKWKETAGADTEVFCMEQKETPEPAGILRRFGTEPLLKAVPGHDWENRYVLNPGALRLNDRVYLFYRAVGEDGISRIGLAVTDGKRVLHRLPYPVFSPETEAEKRGVEDPRLVWIRETDTVWMFYTAYDGKTAQIAAASIRRTDFLDGRFGWRRVGLVFPGVWDKDAVLFPEKIRGKYVLYHRLEPSIWMTTLPALTFPGELGQVIVKPRPLPFWDCVKLGAGSQPLKTAYGWLLFYHGVDRNGIYRLGILLTALEDPGKILYRSPNPVLEPQTRYEIGENGDWVPNVVFTCGAVGGTNREVLEAEDEVWVYYGAADSRIGMAYARIGELIPAAYRKPNEP